MNLFKLAHISDLHFNALSYNPAQFFSKRWLGNLNLIFFRKASFFYERLPALISLFKDKNISHVLISGDFSTTSSKKEFQLGQHFVQQLKNEGFEVITLPGNHDHYTKKDFKKKSFYDFFDPSFEKDSFYNLKEHGIALKNLGHNWQMIVLDTTAFPTLLSSQGHFSPELEKHLKEALSSLKGQNIILANHYPFFQNEPIRKRLVRGDELKRICAENPHVRLYLHGHTHRLCVADLRNSHLPIVLDPGSAPHQTGGGCHLIEINSKGCDVEVFKWNEEWKLFQEHHFIW